MFIVQEKCNGIDFYWKKFDKQLILANNNLSKTKNWQKYIYQVNIILQKVSEKKLTELYFKINNIWEKWRNNKKYKDMLDYLEAKIWIRLSNNL
jgi:hypothetical protein